MICLTEDRLLWTWPGLDFVLDLRFDEVVEISGNTKGQMRLTYEPANFPRGLRAENPNGQVDADFRFEQILEKRLARSGSSALVSWA